MPWVFDIENTEAFAGQADIVFPRSRVLVFVDGDYWHARDLVEGTAMSFADGFAACRRSLASTGRRSSATASPETKR